MRVERPDGRPVRMWLDATPVLHGERAVRRNTRNLLGALCARPGASYGLLYFDRRGSTAGRLALPPDGRCRDRLCRWPISLLLPGWRWLGEPSLERLVGAVDLLYAPDLYFPPVAHGLVLCTIRGLAYLKVGGLLNPRHRRALTDAFNYARRRSDYFLAVSESTRRDLLDCTDISAERIYVVTHGIDPGFTVLSKEHVRQVVRTRFKLVRPYLLFVGAVAHHKNVLGLVEAYALVARKEPDLDLVLAGPEETAAEEARAKVRAAGLEARVHFLGAIPPEDPVLTDLYNAAELLLFPSFYEGWCAPPLEAMACGTPVVCSNVPSVSEVVGDAAVLVDPRNPDAMAAAVRTVLTNTDLRQGLVKAGLERAAQHTWARSAERLEGVFADMLART